jgi:hypothetical protein
LHRFFQGGRICADNNLSEQHLRNPRVDEANWLFFANETGINLALDFPLLLLCYAPSRTRPIGARIQTVDVPRE